MSVVLAEIPRRRVAAVLIAVVALSLDGCVPRMVDNFVAGPVIEQAARAGDVDEACSMGAALTGAILSATRGKRSPHRALIVSETTAALCAEADAWEAGLEAVHAEATMPAGHPARVPAIKDARIREARARQEAAGRFFRAYQHLVAQWGPLDDDDCPRLDTGDQFIYLLGLYAATEAVLHDKAGGGRVGVPLDLLPRVARATGCVDSDRWWSVPRALQAAAWATIPGSAPEGVDPWAQLRETAESGARSGVRLGWGLFALVAANAGRDDDVRMCIRAHAASLEQVPQDPVWALLDVYARRVSLHESDLLWMSARGHRTPVFGRLPGDVDSRGMQPIEVDPFVDGGDE